MNWNFLLSLTRQNSFNHASASRLFRDVLLFRENVVNFVAPVTKTSVSFICIIIVNGYVIFTGGLYKKLIVFLVLALILNLSPVSVFANGEEIETVELSDENNWNHTFEGMPKYEKGKEIEYSVTEDEVEYCHVRIDGFRIINTGAKDKALMWMIGVLLSAAGIIFICKKKEDCE